MIDLLFIHMCSSPGVNPHPTAAIIKVESGFQENALNLNSKAWKIKPPQSRQDAISLGRELLLKGLNIDLGIMQINSENLKPYGLSLEDAFDPCKNIKVGTRILKENYERAEISLGSGQKALKAALSAYNSGNFHSGLENGYVGRLYGAQSLKPEDPSRAGIDAVSDTLVPQRVTPNSPYHSGLESQKEEGQTP